MDKLVLHKLQLFLLLALCSFVCGRVKRDEPTEFSTSLISLRNTGGSHVDLRKSSGDQLKSTFHLANGDVTFEVHKKNQNEAFAEVKSANVALTASDLDLIRSELGYLQNRQTNNPRVKFVVKMLEFFSRASPGFVVASQSFPLKVVYRRQEGSREETDQLVKRSPAIDKLAQLLRSSRTRGRRYQTRQTNQHYLMQCGDFLLSNWAFQPYPKIGNMTKPPTCPTLSVREPQDTTECLCPYHGTVPKEAIYTTKCGQTISWRLRYGSASDNPDWCLGRCGMGCNMLDQEAFQDCFNHDVCVAHLGGPSFIGNLDCDDELARAMDDYMWSSLVYCFC